MVSTARIKQLVFLVFFKILKQVHLQMSVVLQHFNAS